MFKFFKEKLQTLFKSEEKPEDVAKQVKEKPEKKQKAEKKQEKIKKVKEKNKKNEKEVAIETIEPELQEENQETIEQPETFEQEVEEKEEVEQEIETPKLELKKEEKKSSFFDRFRKQKEVEEKEEEVKQEETKEQVKKGIISKIQSKFNTISIDKETFEEFFTNLEELMLENNVALEVVDKIHEDMEKRLVNLEVKKDKLEEEVKHTLRDSISDILIPPFDIIEKIKEKRGTFVILFFGINGAGKTTTIAKVADLLKKNKISCVLAAADTFRAASIEQLSKHGEKLGVKVIHQDYGADPSAVAFDAIKYAEAHQIKVVLIDTAGRMHTKDNLLKEMEKIIRVTKPDLKIFVAESITGNDATEQAKIFNETAHIDGSILTKADVDEKGGTAISIGYVTGKPILFLGTGQEYKDLTKFNPKEILTNLGLE